MPSDLKCRLVLSRIGVIHSTHGARALNPKPQASGEEACFRRELVYLLCCTLRATSHTRLRACDHYTSSTLVGGKGGAGPSSLRTTLEGPTEYVNARWLESPDKFLRGIAWVMFHGHLDYFQKTSRGGYA
jgi:hypothetical protein